MRTVIVSGAIANKPFNGGNVWAVMNWVLGLKKLGFDVHFLEQIARSSCIDASGNPAPLETSANLDFFQRTTRYFRLEGSSAMISDDGTEVFGSSFPELVDLVNTADLLINITGHFALSPLFARLRRKVYLDFDPGYTQFWAASGNDGARLRGHDWYFTVGENIGSPDCTIPTVGIPWHPTRPPVVLDRCTAQPGGDLHRFTTVASWRGAYGRVAYHDRLFGQKAHELRKFIGLPEHVPHSFQIALDIHPADRADREALQSHGWRIEDPKAVVPDADTFHRFLQDSDAEFSVAQGVYVETRSGWFSDRTAHYLALGKPVLVQDTGFRRTYPVGEGLLSFRTMMEAVEGVERIARDYHGHCEAARHLAETHFDSERVLGRMADIVGISP